jgi:hypothetical protein
MRTVNALKTALTSLLALFLFSASLPAAAEPWKFGVMGDTQWTAADPSGRNPDTVPVSIIRQVNRQFISEGVKFVIAVGDLSNDGRDVSERTRAKAAQPLIDAGIGFFPFRGNHETYAGDNGYGIPVFRSNYPQTRTGEFTTTDSRKYKVGSHFSSPVKVSTDLDGISYSFDYGDRGDRARFVIIDPWAVPGKVDKNPDGYSYGYTIEEQQPWISKRLERRTRNTEHAFVFSHQPLIAEGHQDTMFSGYTNAHPDWQDTFYSSMQKNGARFFICGHDHIHQRSIVASPDGKSRVEEIIAASCSSKFYTSRPVDDPRWFGQKFRETPISREQNTIGYSIYTIDGPLVTVDYYSDDHGNWKSDAAFPNGAGAPDTGVTPEFRFVKKESWSYSLNGREFLIAQGSTYTIVQDRFRNTTARILDGSNRSTATEGSLEIAGAPGRPLAKRVDTGWIDRKKTPGKRHNPARLASDILLLAGMGDPGSNKSDQFTLSLSYEPARVSPQRARNGGFGLAVTDEAGRLINAVEKNSGGVRKFVAGPWKKGYELGAYGVDTKKRRAWAVIDFNGRFAAASFDR